MAMDLVDKGIPGRRGGTRGVVKLWVRPFNQAAPLASVTETSHGLLPLEQRHKGITVCLGHSDAITRVKINWPRQLHGIEVGRNVLQAALATRVLWSVCAWAIWEWPRSRSLNG